MITKEESWARICPHSAGISRSSSHFPRNPDRSSKGKIAIRRVSTRAPELTEVGRTAAYRTAARPRALIAIVRSLRMVQASSPARRRQGDKETRRLFPLFSLPVSVSPCLPITASPRLQITQSPASESSASPDPPRSPTPTALRLAGTARVRSLTVPRPPALRTAATFRSRSRLHPPDGAHRM